MSDNPTPHRHAFLSLSTFWFLYLGAAGITYPFYALYLSDNAGLSGAEVGLVVAVPPIVGLFAPALWGRLADRARYPARVLAVGVVGVALLTALIGWLRGFPALLAGSAAAAFFSTGVIPMALAVSFAALGEGARERFGSVRVWGTVGFFILVVLFPIGFHGCQDILELERNPGGPTEPGLEWMFLVAGIINLVAAASALAIPPEREVAPLTGERRDWRELRGSRPFRRALLFAFLAGLCTQGPMSLFPVWVRSRGGDLDTLSHLWVWMLVTEIPLIAFTGQGLRRVGPRGLIAVGVVATGVRWLVCSIASDEAVVYAVQMFHGVTVAGLGVGGPLYVESCVPERLRATGQSLYLMAGVGIGGILSNVGSGWLMDHAGANVPMAVAGSGALVLAVFLPVLLPPPSRGSSTLPNGERPATKSPGEGALQSR